MPSVLVTGAARGIGKAIVEHLASAGWDVVAGVRSEQDATAITKVDPQRVSAVILDITNADHIAKLPDALPKRLDALVNNAGIAVGGPVETVTPDDWRNILEVNVIGQFAVTQAVLPRAAGVPGPGAVHFECERPNRDADVGPVFGVEVRTRGGVRCASG